MPYAEIIGTLAAILTTLSFLPQAVIVVRTRNTSGISLIMYALFTCGIALWFVYGLMTGSWPIIIANGITFIMAVIILAITAQNKMRSPSPQPITQPASQET